MAQVTAVSNLGPMTYSGGTAPMTATSFRELLESVQTDAAAEYASTVHPSENAPPLSYTTLATTTNLLAGGLESSLLLLCMLLSSGGSSDTIDDMVGRLRQMVSALESGDREALRRAIMNSEYEPQVLDEVNARVWDGGGSGRFPYEAWKACAPIARSDAGTRNAELYRDVIDQFAVEVNGRYEVNKKGKNDTYCNIFAWDVTSAMSAEIPHYVDDAGNPLRYPDTDGGHEMNANETYDWLAQKGLENGWIRVTEEEAQMMANQGRPAVSVYKNPSGHGHIQVVCPSRDGGYDETRGATVAQAGSRLTGYAHTGDLSRNIRSNSAFYAHA